MKIAFDHQIFTIQDYGGISRYFSILANELLKNDIEIKAFTGIHQNKYINYLANKVDDGIEINKYPLNTKKIFYVINHLISQTKIHLWKPDLIHETYYSFLPINNNKSIRVVTAYDMIHELFKANFPQNDQTANKKKDVFDRVDHIISISNNTKRDLVEVYGIKESKISVVHLGVDLSRFSQSKRKELSQNNPFILYVGPRSHYKNFDKFISACSDSKIIKNNIKILAFGGGPFSKNEHLRFKKLGFNDNSIEQVSGDDSILVDLYSKAFCFVYPSLYEGFGLPPLEAMASGCPVVSSNTSSMPEVINDAAEFFNPYEIDDIRFAIEKVITSDKRRKELIELGYKNVNLFSWSKCAKQTIGIYERLTGNK